jgi:hypothetical protein
MAGLTWAEQVASDGSAEPGGMVEKYTGVAVDKRAFAAPPLTTPTNSTTIAMTTAAPSSLRILSRAELIPQASVEFRPVFTQQ